MNGRGKRGNGKETHKRRDAIGDRPVESSMCMDKGLKSRMKYVQEGAVVKEREHNVH